MAVCCCVPIRCIESNPCLILRNMRCGGVPGLPYTCWCARLAAVCCVVLLYVVVWGAGPVHTSGGRLVQMHVCHTPCDVLSCVCVAL